ncbi:MAG: hypothetical protein AAF902_13125 [Chloroflexota bacterium]
MESSEDSPNPDKPDKEVVAAILGEMFSRLDRGVCVVCQEKVEYFYQPSSSMYAHPCGHRQMQASATHYNKQLGLTNPNEEKVEPIQPEPQTVTAPTFWQRIIGLLNRKRR